MTTEVGEREGQASKDQLEKLEAEYYNKRIDSLERSVNIMMYAFGFAAFLCVVIVMVVVGIYHPLISNISQNTNDLDDYKPLLNHAALEAEHMQEWFGYFRELMNGSIINQLRLFMHNDNQGMMEKVWYATRQLETVLDTANENDELFGGDEVIEIVSLVRSVTEAGRNIQNLEEIQQEEDHGLLMSVLDLTVDYVKNQTDVADWVNLGYDCLDFTQQMSQVDWSGSMYKKKNEWVPCERNWSFYSWDDIDCDGWSKRQSCRWNNGMYSACPLKLDDWDMNEDMDTVITDINRYCSALTSMVPNA